LPWGHATRNLSYTWSDPVIDTLYQGGGTLVEIILILAAAFPLTGLAWLAGLALVLRGTSPRDRASILRAYGQCPGPSWPGGHQLRRRPGLPSLDRHRRDFRPRRDRPVASSRADPPDEFGFSVRNTLA